VHPGPRARCILIYILNRNDTPSLHVCEAFFQKLPEQDVKNAFMLLVPGRPLVAQGKLWTKCEAEGLGRLRNLAMATELASFKSLNESEREDFRLADKESISLFFSNGSIILVATSRDQITVSAELSNLPWEKCSFKIIAAKVYEGNPQDCSHSNCGKYHACCGSSFLCIIVEKCESFAKVGDVTNFQKALEDDLARRVLNEIFDDKSFVAQKNIRCVRQKLD
jgi:hypothetical protein